MTPSSKRLLVLPLVALLLGLSAWFMSRGEATAPSTPGSTVSFPTEMTRQDRARAHARRTHALPHPASTPERPRQLRVDPLHAALPTDPGAGAVILEANAIRNSPLGETLLACMGGEDLMALSEERTGVDLLNDLDRVALSTEAISLSGHFADADWEAIFPDAIQNAYGESGRLFELALLEDERGARGPPPTIGVWGDSMVIVGTPEHVAATIDRLEGRGPSEKPLIDDSQAYGEIYGVLGAEALALMLGGPLGGELPRELREAASRVELHADALSDVGMVARFQGADAKRVEELGTSFKGLLSMARAKATLEGEEDAVRLLDMAQVAHTGEGFNLQLAVPRSYLEEAAARCRLEREARAAQGATEERANELPLTRDPAAAP